MYLAFGLMTGGSFFGMSRIMNILDYVYFLGFLALGVTFVIATGGIDFSIGPVMFWCALVAGYSLTVKGMPIAIIAKTIKGKNVSFMENKASWHGVAPNAEQYAEAMKELDEVEEALCQM